MKQHLRLATVLSLALLLLAGCVAPLPTPGAEPSPSLEAVQPTPSEEATESPTPTYTGPPAFLSMEEYPVVDGSTATIPLAARLLSHACGLPLEEAELYINHSKTSEAYRNLVYGRADMLIAYEAPEDAVETAQYSGYTWTAEPIGRDALVFLVNEGNPIESLTEQQIRDIYSGKITNWKEVGGEDQDIVPFQRDANSGSQTLMDKLVMRDLAMMEAPADYIPGDMGELIANVQSYDNTSSAIGYSVYYYVKNMYDASGVKMIAVDGVSPSDATIQSGDYPYLNDFYAVIGQETAQDTPARQLFDFLLSEEGAALVRESGYVSVR